MGYLSAWKVLEEMIADFRKRGMPIPAEVINDLKSARTLINILKANSSSFEVGQRVEELLMKVESYVISEGQRRFGSKYVDDWLKKLDEAAARQCDEVDQAEGRFVPGLPREHKWIRIKPSVDLPLEKIRRLAEESGLPCELQGDGYLLIHGEEARMKEFIKKMAAR